MEAMLVDDPEGEGSLNVEGARSLLARWTEQIRLFDADNSYRLRWGANAERVTKDFKDIFDCGYGIDSDGKRYPRNMGAPTMRYYIEVLENEIKDATGEEEED